MSKAKRWLVVLAAAFAVLGFSGIVAQTASAAPLPVCHSAPQVRCTNTNTASPSGGAAGYYTADDLHTHYRDVRTLTTASPTLLNLNGSTTSGGAGVQLCDPNIKFVMQLGVVDVGTATAPAYQLFWSDGKYGTFGTPPADPCVNGGPLFPNPKATCETIPSGPFGAFVGNICGTFNTPTPIMSGDRVYVEVYYDPAPHSKFFHDISFGACDITQNWCVQQYGNNVTLNLWESGIGVFAAQGVQLTAPANNLLVPFNNSMVTCYSCSGAVPIENVQPVNPWGVGGLFEAQLLNGSAQVQMSPNDSITFDTTYGGSFFNVWNGSTTAPVPST